MLGFDEVIYTYATITCDFPGCDNHISLQPGPEDTDRELKDLKAVRELATRRGWSFINDGMVTDCPQHASHKTRCAT